MGETHHKSYLELKNHLNIELEIKLLERRIFKNLQLFFIILFSKITSNKIFFFHECCWPFFDLFIWLLRPKGYFYPQVSMKSFIELSNKKTNLKVSFKQKFFLKIFRKLFSIYTTKDDGGSNKFSHYYMAINKYPPSIRNFTVIDSNKIIKARKKSIPKYERSILFIADKDKISGELLINSYNDLIDSLSAVGYDCYLKQHPDKKNHLSLNNKNLKILDYATPIELLFDDYSYMIGTTSSSLSYFSNISVSIVNFYNDSYFIKRAKLHFNGIDSEKNIYFPKNKKELINYFTTNDRLG